MVAISVLVLQEGDGGVLEERDRIIFVEEYLVCVVSGLNDRFGAIYRKFGLYAPPEIWIIRIRDFE